MQYESMFKIVQDIAVRQQQSGTYVTPDDTICVICSTSQRVFTGVSRVEVRNGQPVNLHAEIIAMQQMQAAGESAAESLLMINAMTCRPMLPCNGCIQFIIQQNPENAKCLVVLPDRNIPLTEVGRPTGSMPFNSAMPGNSMYMNNGSMPFNGAMPMGGSVYNSGVMPYGGAMPMNHSGYVSGSVPYGGAAPVGSVYGQSSQMSQPYANANPAGGYVGASLPTGSQKAKNSNADYLKNRVGNLMQVADDDDEEEEDTSAKGLLGKLFKK